MITSQSLFSFPIIEEQSPLVEAAAAAVTKSPQKRRTEHLLDCDKKRRASSSCSHPRIPLKAAMLGEKKRKEAANQGPVFAEFMKLNAMFNRGSMRATSCSKSQSHSRVRRSSM